MRFKTEKERMQHPQAGLIPQSLWISGLFSYELPDDLLPLMQAEESSLITLLPQTHKEIARIKMTVWVAIALSHLSLEPPSLLDIGLQLGMNDDQIFSVAARIGRLNMMKYLDEQPGVSLDRIKVRNASIFFEAVEHGHVDVLRYSEEKAKTPERLQEMVRVGNFVAFKQAASNGHVDMLRYLTERTPERLQEMIRSDYFYAFRYAAMNGHLDVLRYLEKKAPEKLQEMIGARDFWAFQQAARYGHLDVLRYLEEKAPGRLQEMIADGNIADGNSGTFRKAAGYGHLDVLRYLEEKAPGRLQEMIAEGNFGAFQGAAGNGHLDVLGYLEEKAPGRLQDMIAANDFSAFLGAAIRGHLDVLRYLEEKAPGRLQDMIAANDFSAFVGAAREKRQQVTQHLLSHSSVLAFAEQHVHEYQQYVNPFITQKMEVLYAQKNALEQEQPQAVFNIEDANEVKLLFYVLRNLIRRNSPELRDDIAFLLNIPGVKALVHTEVSPGQSNELLRLALTVNNQEAAELLLNIPAVQELASAANYYHAEQQGGLDLRALAQNNESSMTALSSGEKERLGEALQRYQPMIAAAGKEQILLDLRDTLVSRYEAHPAKVLRDTGEWLELPLQWQDFQQLALSPQEFKNAFKAYVSHKDHTAWRYLSKPNPWMHEQAAYVNVNPDNLGERWSTFEEYKSEIALFYLSAIDSSSEPIDGYTVETRLEGFIDELALIGRAHNWDNQRIKMDANDNLVLDDENNPIQEEYDDLEGDRPSCYSGVKRRLFQSVKGHVLLTMLTQERIREELRDFVRQHFKKAICVNRKAIKEVWEKQIVGDELEEKDWELIKSLDISSQKQERFIGLLKKKYGGQFTSEPEFAKAIKTAFLCQGAKDAHLFNFGYAHPEDFFEENASDAIYSLSLDNLLSQLEAHSNAKELEPKCFKKLLISLKQLQEKSISLQKNKHPTAAKAAKNLIKGIGIEMMELLRHDQDITTFRENCAEHIHTAQISELKDHRGWKQFLVNLLTVISGVGLVAAAINYARTGGKHFFFETKTDSSHKVDALEQHIQHQSIKPSGNP